MNKDLEAKTLEYVEINARASHWENEKTGKKETFVSVWYPKEIEEQKLYSEVFPTPDNSEIERKEIETRLKKISQRIIEEINYLKEDEELGGFNWVFKGMVYKVCPEMLCGNNPCSCKEKNNAE